MKFNLLLPSVAVLISMSACSQNGNVSLKGVDLSTSEVGSETYVNMEAIVAMGNLKLPSTEVPILNPTNQQVLGQMSLEALTDGTNRLSVSIDYQAATKLDPSLGATLPNQRELPTQLGLTSDTKMIGIPILQQSRIYIGGDLEKNLYIGAAIAVPAFDTVLDQVPLPLNIFFAFPFSTEVTGYAGLFTGPQKGQNGLGVFVKKIAPTTPVTPAAKSMNRSLASVETGQIVAPTGGEELSKLDTFTIIKLDRLLKKKATLKIK